MLNDAGLGGGLSTTTPPTTLPPLSTTTAPVDLQDLQNLQGSIFEDNRNSGVSIKPLGVQTPFQTVSNGFNAIVTPVPNTLDTTTIDGPAKEVFRPFDFSARPQIQLTTTLAPVTEFPSILTTTDSAGFNVHLNHFGINLNHSTIPGNAGISAGSINSIPTQDVKDEKKLQETILDILAENIDHPMKDQVVNKIKEDISINSGLEITTTLPEPVGPNFERLGPHIVPKIFRPNQANVVEAQIHKTYEGQEFIGEDTLESLGNDITNLVYYI